MIHICLISWFLNGPYIRDEDNFRLLARIFYSFQGGRFQDLGDQFVYLMDHYYYSRYGVLTEAELSEIYTTEVQNVYYSLWLDNSPQTIGFYVDSDLDVKFSRYPFVNPYNPVNESEKEKSEYSTKNNNEAKQELTRTFSLKYGGC